VLARSCLHAHRSTEALSDNVQRLEATLSGLVDVPTIMTTMPSAIKKAVQVSQ
jgi:hypothetical protein